MKEPSTKDEIPALCNSYFLSMTRAIYILWVIVGIAGAYVATTITFAMTTNTDIVGLKDKVLGQQNRLDILDKQINSKLDVLIARKDANLSSNKRD